MERDIVFKDECYAIIGACMYVHSILGYGFLEAVYQEALEIEFARRNIPFQRQIRLRIYYDGQPLNKYYIADFICYGKIVIEIKAVSMLINTHQKQLYNYLKATNSRLGLLINFGEHSLNHDRVLNPQVV